jgi:hypothetical protein
MDLYATWRERCENCCIAGLVPCPECHGDSPCVHCYGGEVTCPVCGGGALIKQEVFAKEFLINRSGVYLDERYWFATDNTGYNLMDPEEIQRENVRRREAAGNSIVDLPIITITTFFSLVLLIYLAFHIPIQVALVICFGIIVVTAVVASGVREEREKLPKPIACSYGERTVEVIGRRSDGFITIVISGPDKDTTDRIYNALVTGRDFRFNVCSGKMDVLDEAKSKPVA